MSIALILFTYNEINALPHCFKHLSPFDQYIIGIDSRTNDGSDQWLKDRNYDFYYFHFTDFSQIYNDAIKKCTTDWIMTLSPDETLSGDIRNLTDADCHAFPRRNWYDLEMIKSFDKPDEDYQGRLFRNNGKIWWQGKVHEQVSGWESIKYHNDIIINHFALHYEKIEPERLQRKIKLYRELGEVGYRLSKEYNLNELSLYMT
jgi:hypothetical protein